MQRDVQSARQGLDCRARNDRLRHEREQSNRASNLGVEYTFTGWNGRTYKGWQTHLRDRDWKVGADTAVYYDGADPSRNALEIGQLRLTAESDSRAVRLCLAFALLTGIFQFAVRVRDRWINLAMHSRAH